MKSKIFRIFLAVCLSILVGRVVSTNAQKAELVIQTGHSSTVLAVVFSPDGRTLASGGLGDHTIKLWEVKSGKELRTLTGHADEIRNLAFSADGMTLASKSLGDTVKVWNTASGEELRTFDEPGLWSIALSPDGKMLALGNMDGTIKLRDVESGKEIRTFAGHPYTTYIQKDITNTQSQKFRRSSIVWSLAFSPDGKTIASGSDDNAIKIWNTESGKELRTLTGHSDLVRSVAFSPDGKSLASGSDDRTVRVWNMENGTELRSLRGHTSEIEPIAFSQDGMTLASSDEKRIKFWNLETGKEIRTLTLHSDAARSIAFSPDLKTLASTSDETIRIWDADSEKELRTLSGYSIPVELVAFRSNGRTLESKSNDQMLIWDLEGGKGLRSLPRKDSFWTAKLKTVTGYPDFGAIAFSPDKTTFAITAQNEDSTIEIKNKRTGKTIRSFRAQNDHVGSLTFSRDGRMLASGSDDQTVTIWNARSGIELWTFTGHSSSITSVAFSTDGKMLATGSLDKTIKIWNTERGKELKTLTGHTAGVGSVTISQDGKLLASEGSEGKTKLWDVATGKELCSLIAIDENDWVVATPDGRFDTNKIEDSKGFHWVVSDDPFKPAPLEIFMRDYYEPQLLPRILECHREGNCDREFKPLPNIGELNRVQPPVKITNVSLPDVNRKVQVTVEVGRGVVSQSDCRMKLCETDGYDLRLFRDRQIVGTYPRDGQAELIRQTESSDVLTSEKDLWRKVTAIKFEKTIDCQTGAVACTTQTFEVELPKGKNSAEVEFSAYAFNEDRVKSQTARWKWPEDMRDKLPKAQAVKPKAYIIAVGVNAYENSEFDLEFAADDARRMAEVVTQKLKATGQYEKVIPVALISDYVTKAGRRTVIENQATKETFHAVLDLLAGKRGSRQLLVGVKNADQLQKATPDDLILIMYSSHGYADRVGNFYFIPYDTGPGKGTLFTETVRQHSISSDELSLWLRDVDAGEMIMIVDACHSSAAIEGSDFKPGPMGSRGLGQLSYDKGMKILTATQSDSVALENNLIKQGLLTYALVRDGIEARQADFKPEDNVINIGEWLSYGVDRVPKLYEEVKARKIQNFGISTGQQTIAVVAVQKGKSRSKALEEVVEESKAQQPSLFDFARQHKEVVLVR